MDCAGGATVIIGRSMMGSIMLILGDRRESGGNSSDQRAPFPFQIGKGDSLHPAGIFFSTTTWLKNYVSQSAQAQYREFHSFAATSSEPVSKHHLFQCSLSLFNSNGQNGPVGGRELGDGGWSSCSVQIFSNCCSIASSPSCGPAKIGRSSFTP